MCRKLSYLICLALVAISFSAHALRDGFCKIKPHELGPVSMRILKQSQLQGEKEFPVTSIIQTDMSMELGSEAVTAVTATYEAFLRVEQDGIFSILPVPIASVELNHDRNIVYICAHVEPDRAKSFLEIYFLIGSSLGDITGSFLRRDLFIRPIKVNPVPISPIGFDSIGNVLEKLGSFPFNLIAAPFHIVGRAQRVVMAGVNKVLPTGVERIIMTNKQILFSTNVNLENPEKAFYNYKIDVPEKASPSKK